MKKVKSKHGVFQQRKNCTKVLRKTKMRRKTTTELTEMKTAFNELISRLSRCKGRVIERGDRSSY